METEVDKLHKLLTTGDRKLKNIKLFPGVKPGTAEDLAKAAFTAIESAIGTQKNDPPISNRRKSKLMDI